MSTERPSQAGAIVDLASAWYRFGQAMDGEPFAVALTGPGIARMLRGGRSSLRAELAATYNAAHHRVPSAQALADALAVLEGMALTAPREPLALRVASSPAGVYHVDLGDPSGRAVRVDRDGWAIVARPPVLFRRSELTAALPEPVAGDLEPYLELLNVSGDDRSAVLAYLVAVLMSVPVPILFARGPAGAAKSSAASLIVRLLDPSPAPLRAAPRDLEAWAVAAAGSVIVGLDNLTTIPDWFSDALCRAVTGEALVRRALYSDSGLSVVAFRRAVILTAIDAGALRGDLADRLLTLDLPEIAEADRLEDAEVEADFLAAWPGALGGLLELASAVIRTLPDIHLERRPRMADYGRILAAVDELRGTAGLARYLAQRSDLAREAAEGDLIGAALMDWMRERESWTGTAGALLEALTPDKRPPKGWPTTARGLAGALRRLLAPLRAAGIVIEFDRESGTGGRRLVTVTCADPAEPEPPDGDGSDGRYHVSPYLSVWSDTDKGTPANIERADTTVATVATVATASRLRVCPSCQGSHPAGMTCIEATA